MVNVKPMNRQDKVFLGTMLAVFLITVYSVYLTNVETMGPHEEDLRIRKCYSSIDWASGIIITQIITENRGVLYYAGNYTFNAGNYTVYSEGEPGWLYRKITKLEILTEQKRLEMELKVP